MWCAYVPSQSAASDALSSTGPTPPSLHAYRSSLVARRRLDADGHWALLLNLIDVRHRYWTNIWSRGLLVESCIIKTVDYDARQCVGMNCSSQFTGASLSRWIIETGCCWSSDDVNVRYSVTTVQSLRRSVLLLLCGSALPRHLLANDVNSLDFVINRFIMKLFMTNNS